MKVFECNSIAEAHMQLVNFVMWNKSNVMTEDNQQTYEAPPVTVTIKQPLKDMIHNKSPAQLQFCEAYTDQILNGTKNDFDYTYHDRLFNYEGYLDWILRATNKIKLHVCRISRRRPSSPL